MSDRESCCGNIRLAIWRGNEYILNFLFVRRLQFRAGRYKIQRSSKSCPLFAIAHHFNLKSMLVRSLFSSVLLLAILFSACKQVKSNSLAADAFLIKLDSFYVKIDKTGNLFDAYYQNLAKVFVDNNRMQLRSQQIDSVKFLFADYLRTIKKSREEIEKIPEFDRKFGLVGGHTEYLVGQEKFWGKWVPIFIQLYELGWTNLSDQQKKEMIESTKLMRDEQTISTMLHDSLVSLTINFAKEYHVTYNSQFLNR
jgi:hypothetical protein